MTNSKVSIRQIGTALGLSVRQLDRLSHKLGLRDGIDRHRAPWSFSWEQALALALTERYRKYADFEFDVKADYQFILSQVQAFGAYIDSYAMVIDQGRKQIAFSARREAADLLVIEGSVLTGGAFIIVAIHPLCRKLAGLFNKAFVPMAVAVK